MSFQNHKTFIHLRNTNSLRAKTILVASYNYGWTTDVTWTILTISLSPFWALIVVGPLLSIKDQRALGFNQKYLNLCFEDERRSCGFGMTWGWVINDLIFIFSWWKMVSLKYQTTLTFAFSILSDIKGSVANACIFLSRYCMHVCTVRV